MRLVFLDNRAQVAAVHGRGEVDAQTTLVAMTAEALDALDAARLQCRPISSVGRPSALSVAERDFTVESVRLLSELESFAVERHPGAYVDGPGFLMCQDYNVQISIIAIATRAYLMREAIRAMRPDAVAAYVETTEPWFAGDGYAEAPWIAVLEGLEQSEGFRLERLRLPDAGERQSSPQFAGTRRIEAANLRARKLARFLIENLSTRGRTKPGQPRLLFVGLPGYDWLPVVRKLRGRAECFWLSSELFDPSRDWTQVLDGRLHKVGRSRSRGLVPRFQPDDGEAGIVAEIARTWLRESRSSLDVLGIDILPALGQNLVAIASHSPAIARHVDAVSQQALEATAPDVVCFSSMTLLPAKRLAHQCRQRSIDVVCYQHGGSYSTHDWTPHQLAEWAHSDYFLTYGEGIEPPPEPAFPVRARFVPVGSARIDSWRRGALPRTGAGTRAAHVLWIAESATRNTANFCLVEDTERYLLERRCLEILSTAGIAVTYRPYAGQAETSGVLGWLSRDRPATIRVAEPGPLARLIRGADVVISDSGSGTAWNEVLALEKPLLLYCDPAVARLTPEFAADLDGACLWCKTAEEFTAAVDDLAAGKSATRDDSGVERFLTRYVLNGGHPADRVVSLLEHLRSQTGTGPADSTSQPNRGRR